MPGDEAATNCLRLDPPLPATQGGQESDTRLCNLPLDHRAPAPPRAGHASADLRYERLRPLLFDSPNARRYRRVPRRVRSLPDLHLDDEAWDSLQLPINLAFFFHSTPAGRVVALYPSPAGATESLVAAEAWGALADDNPALRDLEPDVEGLLVNRIGESRDSYCVGIDQCYRLVGLIRSHWKGLSGGAMVWGEIAGFFADLERRCH